MSITKRILLRRAQKERLKKKGAAVRRPRPLMHPLPPKILPLRPWRSLMQVQVFTTLSTPCSTSQWQQGRLVPNLNMAGVTYTTSMQCTEVNMRHHPLRHMVGIQHIQGRLILMHMPSIMGIRSMDMVVTMEKVQIRVFDMEIQPLTSLYNPKSFFWFGSTTRDIANNCKKKNEIRTVFLNELFHTCVTLYVISLCA